MMLGRLRSWWQALRAVWVPFLVVRVALLLWGAIVAIVWGTRDDYGNVFRAAWPPTAPWGLWLERTLLQPWLHYDVHHYLGIAVHGFANHPEWTVFYPLYPLGIWLGGQVLGQPLVAAMVLNFLAQLGLVVFLYRYVGEEFSPAVGRWTVISLLTFPVAFLFAVPYSEAPFVALVVLAFWAAWRRNWPLAGVAGLLAVLCRQPGLLLLPALGLEWFLWALRERRREAWLAGLWLGLLPLAAWGYAFYLQELGVVQTSPLHPLSPLLWVSDVQARFWHSYFVPPWETVRIIAAELARGTRAPFLINLVWTLVLTGLAVGALWAWKRPDLWVYTGLMLLASWSKVLAPPCASPIDAFPRHLLVIFPVFLLLGRSLERWAPARVAWLVLAPLLLLFQSTLYLLNAWIP